MRSYLAGHARLAPVSSYKDGTFRTLHQHYSISLSTRARARVFVCGFKTKIEFFCLSFWNFLWNFQYVKWNIFQVVKLKYSTSRWWQTAPDSLFVLNIQMILMQLSFLFCHQLWIHQFLSLPHFSFSSFSCSAAMGTFQLHNNFTHHFSKLAFLFVPSIDCTPFAHHFLHAHDI